MKQLLFSIKIGSKSLTAPTLIILHGFLGMSDNWKTLGTKFSEKFNVHLIDLRNHGHSFHSNDFNYDVMVDDLFVYFSENKIQTAYVLGHSMGGKLAMFFSVKYPNLVRKLVVVDIGPKFYAPHHEAILAGLNAIDFSLQPSRTKIDDILKSYVADLTMRQFLMKNLYWQQPNQLAFRFNLDAINKNIQIIGESLKENSIFEKPTLFLKGEYSKYIIDEDFDLITKHFPNSEIKTIANAGHWLHAENPIQFFDEVVLFLEKN